MKFGPVPLREAEGGVAVHSIRKDGLVLKKGTLIGKAEIAALADAGISRIVVARMEPGDVSEDTAAAQIAAAIRGEAVRVDLIAFRWSAVAPHDGLPSAGAMLPHRAEQQPGQCGQRRPVRPRQLRLADLMAQDGDFVPEDEQFRGLRRV